MTIVTMKASTDLPYSVDPYPQVIHDCMNSEVTLEFFNGLDQSKNCRFERETNFQDYLSAYSSNGDEFQFPILYGGGSLLTIPMKYRKSSSSSHDDPSQETITLNIKRGFIKLVKEHADGNRSVLAENGEISLNWTIDENIDGAVPCIMRLPILVEDQDLLRPLSDIIVKDGEKIVSHAVSSNHSDVLFSPVVTDPGIYTIEIPAGMYRENSEANIMLYQVVGNPFDELQISPAPNSINPLLNEIFFFSNKNSDGIEWASSKKFLENTKTGSKQNINNESYNSLSCSLKVFQDTPGTYILHIPANSLQTTFGEYGCGELNIPYTIGDNSGVSEIEEDSNEVEYFDLSGQKIIQPDGRSPYIEKRAGHYRKRIGKVQ